MIKIYNFGEIKSKEFFSRMSPETDVSDIVSNIIDDVRKNGDEALFRYTEKFDKAKLSELEVSTDEIDDAINSVSPDFMRILTTAAENIKTFHQNQKRSGYICSQENGVLLGQRVIPLQKAGIYVPGGTAAYPSTVLMDAIPAKIAGCEQVIMVSPPGADGKINFGVLAAAYVAGVDRVFKVGGAQAIAALAYGTQSIPGVDKIVGPGNAFVAEAKKQVFGKVAIDMIAGPSEILVIADKTACAKHVAADLLSQAEHDRLASAVLITESSDLAFAVQQELEKQLPMLERCEIARASIENNGKIIIASNGESLADIANELAPEHLELCVDNPFDYLSKIKNAGSVFLGKYCPEALGDYYAGPNHTLPTGGTARFSSPLSVDDFVKKSQFIYYPREAFTEVAKDIDTFARVEGLTAHAKSATVRLEDNIK